METGRTYSDQNMGSSAEPKLGKASRYGFHLDEGVVFSIIKARISLTQPLGDSNVELSKREA